VKELTAILYVVFQKKKNRRKQQQTNKQHQNKIKQINRRMRELMSRMKAGKKIGQYGER